MRSPRPSAETQERWPIQLTNHWARTALSQLGPGRQVERVLPNALAHPSSTFGEVDPPWFQRTSLTEVSCATQHPAQDPRSALADLGERYQILARDWRTFPGARLRGNGPADSPNAIHTHRTGKIQSYHRNVKGFRFDHNFWRQFFHHRDQFINGYFRVFPIALLKRECEMQGALRR